MGYEEYTIDGLIPMFLMICVYVITRVVLILKNKKIDWHREVSRLFLVLYLGVLIVVTLFPINIIIGEYEQRYREIVVNLNPMQFFGLLDADFSIIIRNLGGNLVMMIPFAILLPVNFRGMRQFGRVIMVVVATSIVIEILQYIWQLTMLNVWRTTDINDVILNVCGGIIGYALYYYLFLRVPFMKRFII
ncbi:vanZ protein [Listeria grandensis FSL F6-0971]|uniref:VanZ protein n=2 Tax=Listeria grandensis TaxID=1494963 RepID=W7AY07_9LIST|nr:vanZ protein [Listeria grandensis FSL F6-0971]